MTALLRYLSKVRANDDTPDAHERYARQTGITSEHTSLSRSSVRRICSGRNPSPQPAIFARPRSTVPGHGHQGCFDFNLHRGLAPKHSQTRRITNRSMTSTSAT